MKLQRISFQTLYSVGVENFFEVRFHLIMLCAVLAVLIFCSLYDCFITPKFIKKMLTVRTFGIDVFYGALAVLGEIILGLVYCIQCGSEPSKLGPLADLRAILL